VANALYTDGRRIGTIHGLCAEILHAHPAEAAIDPRFAVLDEGLTSALRAQVVEDTLGSFVEDPVFMPLFTLLETRELAELLHLLMEHRLEANECFAQKLDSPAVVKNYLEAQCTILSWLINCRLQHVRQTSKQTNFLR
jgi:ATP-dependent exoDNAse (exonuclease V) beta subunit